MANRFLSTIKSGVSGVQRAYREEKAAGEARAAKRLANANSRHEKERVRAEERQRSLILERQMYEAKAAVERER